MTPLTLLRQGSPLSRPENQLKIISSVDGQHKSFDSALRGQALFPLYATGVEVLQINLGKLCNQACRHCHVDAGPERREIMSRETVAACLDVLARTEIPTVDITGGAPEMNPHFRWLVEESRRLGKQVIDRCNLTILLAPGFDDLVDFLAMNQVEVIASLPCYLETNTDQQRGTGVFAKSVEALRRLNAAGYGRSDGPLTLTLVYNPLGPSLPPPQDKLEATYKRELQTRYGIVFNRLFTITNMPISRFLDDLLQTGQYDDYMRTLIDAYNPLAAERVMCRTTLSVDWEGRLHDCDFNQMLDLGLDDGLPRNIRDFNLDKLTTRRILTGNHCFGCTAGAGSTCQGAVLP